MSSDEFYDLYAQEFPDIAPERLHFISAIANDTWVDNLSGGDPEFEAAAPVWRSREIEFVTTCPNPRELFLFVDLYNWSKGYDQLKAVAVNPACDVSTALAMFWKSSPIYHQEFATSDAVPEYNRPGWDFVMGLIHRLNIGLYRPPASAFDPEEWDSDDANSPGSKWMIPPYLCLPIDP